MKAIRDLLIVRAQVSFFRRNLAGCTFAAYAARNPRKYGWTHRVLDIDVTAIDGAIRAAIQDERTSTLSLIFRKCSTRQHLLQLIRSLQTSKYVFLEQDVEFGGFRCLGFRTKVGSDRSWITGLGPFSFFPVTRRGPYTELVMRVKPRPPYEKTMKKSPPGVIHLADMDMLGIPDADFKRMWASSMTRTAALIGHKPDLKSAAKTTFVLPVN